MTEGTFNEKKLVHKNENKYFWIVLSISIASYILFALSIAGILIIAAFLIMSLVLHALMIGQIRLNAVKIGGNQFPLIHSTVEELCIKMGIKRTPDIYVLQSGGIMNAFATRFFGRNMVVVYSEIFELIEQNAEEELQFVLAHELAHIKRNHLGKLMFILPSMWIPGIAEMYLRACEYTCDRYAAFYIGNPAAAKNGLTMLAIGKVLFRRVNKTEYLDQINKEKGLVVWLAEILSTHPPLPKRMNEISLFFGGKDSVIVPSKNSKALIAFVAASFMLTGLAMVGGLILYNKVNTTFSSENDEAIEVPPLIEAVINGNPKKVESLIENGEDIHQIDYNGYTSLDWAVMDDNVEMVQLLLDLKADPNYESDYGMTPFMTAAERGNVSMIDILYDAGGDPNYQEMGSGYTAMTYAIFSGETDKVKLLIELGAEIGLTDYSGMTARMHALQSGEQEIADLLK
ncbi:ankyrin repeat domain-containing protein [Bacillus sp. ISL-39]|uniref:M48 family metallopeptidase n=1 Tax=Bacillus sp. ISL-39 TaxID=2819124 RepID=UPI001BE68DFB|nr:ankyrin repeat domain-containing protein [Bacillus sp. ISL-39]MBT2638299.1 ankyrin repeat domain-containing protein [Bacillus sp. ISL-39]